MFVAPLPVFLATDFVMAALLGGCVATVVFLGRRPDIAARWKLVLARPSASASLVVLGFFFAIALLDSVHYRKPLPPAEGAVETAYSPVTTSLFDDLVFNVLGAAGPERSYSAPFAVREFDKSTAATSAGPVRDFQPLRSIRRDASGEAASAGELATRAFVGGAAGTVAGVLLLGIAGLVRRAKRKTCGQKGRDGMTGEDRRRRLARLAQLAPRATFVLLFALTGGVLALWPERHVLGTDAAGTDVLYEALKSLRTAIVIGTLATLSALPFAVTAGLTAGYFRGWADDVIQYIYTTLSSIPGVLLIAAAVLMTTAFMDRFPERWPTGLERADMRLFLLALIIGFTSWATLARLIRAEAMRIASLDYVLAARALGVPAPMILLKHVLPNVLHIVLIVTVLDFSGVVLYEAVLSYVGVGVDPVMNSFGTMVNAARSEMSRSPVVWWNLAAAFLFLVTFVLCASLVAAAVRDAFDPHAVLEKEDR